MRPAPRKGCFVQKKRSLKGFLLNLIIYYIFFLKKIEFSCPRSERVAHNYWFRESFQLELELQSHQPQTFNEARCWFIKILTFETKFVLCEKWLLRSQRIKNTIVISFWMKKGYFNSYVKFTNVYYKVLCITELDKNHGSKQ